MPRLPVEEGAIAASITLFAEVEKTIGWKACRVPMMSFAKLPPSYVPGWFTASRCKAPCPLAYTWLFLRAKRLAVAEFQGLVLYRQAIPWNLIEPLRGHEISGP